MEDEKEIRDALRLGDYIDGVAEAAGGEYPGLPADLETVNLLRVGFGDAAAPDEVFARRLRNDLVKRAGKRELRFHKWAMLAASLLMLLGASYFFIKGAQRETNTGAFVKTTPEANSKGTSADKQELNVAENTPTARPEQPAAVAPAPPAREEETVVASVPAEDTATARDESIPPPAPRPAPAVPHRPARPVDVRHRGYPGGGRAASRVEPILVAEGVSLRPAPEMVGTMTRRVYIVEETKSMGAAAVGIMPGRAGLTPVSAGLVNDGFPKFRWSKLPRKVKIEVMKATYIMEPFEGDAEVRIETISRTWTESQSEFPAGAAVEGE